jgi:hypothetical protein
MSDGWLFRLRSNLGSRYVAPAWPAQAEPGAHGVDSKSPGISDVEVNPEQESDSATADTK